MLFRSRFHGKTAGDKAVENFISRFQKGAMPDNIEEHGVDGLDGSIGIASLLKSVGLVASTSEAMRMIKQGAVKIDGERVDDSRLKMVVGSLHIYQVGKRRFAKVRVE